MALTYNFLLNGRTLNATIGAMVHDKLEEALDESALNLPITTLGFPHKILGLLKINITDENLSKEFNYLVISDEVSLSSKEGYYQHNLTAIEYTHKLDKMFVSALTFTKPFVRRARAPFKYFGVTQNEFGLLAVRSMFPKVEFKENYFTGETTTIPRVGQCLVTYGLLEEKPNQRKTVYVQTNVEGYQELHNLTQSNLVITFPDEPLDYEMNVGYLEDSEFVVIFKHFVRTIKEQRYTLYDMIQRVRAVIPVERQSFFDKTRVFELENELVDLFKTIEMPQMFFKHQTARQVINTMFKYINAISRLKHVENQKDDLSVDFFNKILTEFTSEDIVTRSIDQNAQDYGTRAISFLSQTLQTNFRDNPSVVNPANNLYKTVRAKNIQLTQNNFEIKLEKPIYEITKITAVLPSVELKIKNSDGRDLDPDFLYVKEDYYLDITTRTLEKTFWDLKQNTVDFITYTNLDVFDENVGMRLNKNANIYWQKNSKSIDLSLQIGETFKENILEEMLQDALNEEFLLRLYDQDVFGSKLPLQSNNDFGFEPVANVKFYGNFPVLIDPESGEQILIPSITTNTIFRNVKFNIEYVTLDDTVIRQERLDTEFINYESDIRINNFETISDYGRVSRDLFGKIERSGLPKQTISKVHINLSDVLDVGQIDKENYIITERKLIFHNEFIEGIYTLTKNHNRLNEFNGINQEFRAFEIPTFNETVKRLDFYSDYIYIVNPNQTARIPYSGNDTTIYDFKNKFETMFTHLNGKVYSEPFSKITYAFVRTDGFLREFPDFPNSKEYSAIITPVVSFGGKNNLNFNFKFDNNQVAGDAINPFEFNQSDNILSGILNIFSIRNYYNKPIRYTDELGFFDKLWFGMGSKYESTKRMSDIAVSAERYFNESYSYPLVVGDDENLNQDFSIQNSDIFNPDWFLVYKDSATNYGFSYQLNILPLDYQDYVIGQNFYTENPLVNNTTSFIQKKLYVYEDGTKYNIFDDLKIKSGFETSLNLTTNNLITNEVSYLMQFDEDALAAISNATSWAIGDENGNLYIACNKPYNGFGVLSRHRRLNTLTIGQLIDDDSSELNDYLESNLQTTFEILLSETSFITDILYSDLRTFQNIQESLSGSKTEFLASNLFVTETLFQPSYVLETSAEIITSQLNILGATQENINSSVIEILKSEFIIKANSQESIREPITNILKSELILEYILQENQQLGPNEILNSNLNLFYNIEENILFGPSHILTSELTLSYNLVEDIEYGSPSDILQSELILKYNSVEDVEFGAPSDTLNSDLVIDGIPAFAVYAAVITDENPIVMDTSWIFNLNRDSEFELDETITNTLFFIGNNNSDASVQYNVPLSWEYNGKDYEFERARFTIGDSPEYQTTQRIFSIATTDVTNIIFEYRLVPEIQVQAKIEETTTGGNLEYVGMTFRVFDSQSNIVLSESVTLDSGYGFAITVPDATGNSLEVLPASSFVFGPETYIYQSMQVYDDALSLVTTLSPPNYEYLITDPNNTINTNAYYNIRYRRQNKQWTYLGTSNPTFDDTITYNYDFDTCSFSYTSVLNSLNTTNPARNYNPNFIMRVNVRTDNNFFCRYEYYIADGLGT